MNRSRSGLSLSVVLILVLEFPTINSLGLSWLLVKVNKAANHDEGEDHVEHQRTEENNRGSKKNFKVAPNEGNNSGPKFLNECCGVASVPHELTNGALESIWEFIINPVTQCNSKNTNNKNSDGKENIEAGKEDKKTLLFAPGSTGTKERNNEDDAANDNSSSTKFGRANRNVVGTKGNKNDANNHGNQVGECYKMPNDFLAAKLASTHQNTNNQANTDDNADDTDGEHFIASCFQERFKGWASNVLETNKFAILAKSIVIEGGYDTLNNIASRNNEDSSQSDGKNKEDENKEVNVHHAFVAATTASMLLVVLVVTGTAHADEGNNTNSSTRNKKGNDKPCTSRPSCSNNNTEDEYEKTGKEVKDVKD